MEAGCFFLETGVEIGGFEGRRDMLVRILDCGD